MRIEFSDDACGPRNWRVGLARRLKAGGHRATCQRRNGPRDQGAEAGFALLFAFERIVYGIAVPDAIDAKAVMPNAMPDDAKPELAIDFDGSALASPVEILALVPLYDGRPGEAAAMEALLDGRAPSLSVALRAPADGEARLVATGLPALTEPRIFTRSLDNVLSRMSALLLNAIAALVSKGPAGLDEALPLMPRPSRRPPGPGRATAFILGSLKAKVAARLARMSIHPDHWRIGFRFTAGDETGRRLDWPASPYAFLRDDGARYYADPFIFWHRGVAHVFCEEYPYAMQKGVISVFTISPDGGASPPRIVLERPYHLSYPMVIERDGAIFMIPESSANRTVEIYRAVEFPHEWRLERVLIEKVEASDATLLEHDGRLWLFATLSEAGSSSWDTLGLFHAQSLMGPWSPHAANPLLIDAGTARPAGMMFSRQGALIRPAQDCTRGYGSGLALCRIDLLDTEHYRQSLLTKLAPLPAWHADGTHTLNAAGGLEVIDSVGPLAKNGKPIIGGGPPKAC